MINIDNITKENIIEHNPNWSQIRDHPYRLLIIGVSGSGKMSPLFILRTLQPDIDEIYLYVKDPYETKYQFLTNKRKFTGLEYFNDSKAFIEYWNDMNYICKTIEEYHPNKKRTVLIAFDDMIANMLNNEKNLIQ